MGGGEGVEEGVEEEGESVWRGGEAGTSKSAQISPKRPSIPPTPSLSSL